MYTKAMAAALALFASPLAAQDMVSASDPQAMLETLKVAGYEPELDTDEYDDPMLHIDLYGYHTDVLFYGCDEDTHGGCDAIQFHGAFDTNGSVDADAALEVAGKYRFAQINIDSENDIEVRWDVVIGSGIPSSVFLMAVESFGDALDNVAGAVFPEETPPPVTALAN